MSIKTDLVFAGILLYGLTLAIFLYSAVSRLAAVVVVLIYCAMIPLHLQAKQLDQGIQEP